MAFQKNNDYNEVSDRILEFREKHPEGSLQSDEPIWVRDADGKIIGVTIRCLAYRTPDDPRPGHGTAYEPVPGRTPYTKDSEVQNAETSSWGRALIAVGAADAKKGIASANEVRNRQFTEPEKGRDAQLGKADDELNVVRKRSEIGKALAAKRIPRSNLQQLLDGFDKGYTGLSTINVIEDLTEVAKWVDQQAAADG